MSFWNNSFVNGQLSKQTSIFGLKLWVVIAIFAGAFIVLFLSLCLASRRRRPSPAPTPPSPVPSSRKPLKLLLLHDATPQISKEILAISPPSKPDHRVAAAAAFVSEQYSLPLPPPPASSSSASGGSKASPRKSFGRPSEVSHLGWGHWYTLRQLETATEQFADENVIGEGGYGIVYRGVLADWTIVAVKNLLNNNRGQAEKDVYSFGVLIMEIITARTPADYTKPPGEVNLVEWLKTMVGEGKSEQAVDPKMLEKPSPKALKRALLVALRCVDPDAQKRPRMGHVIHMLEAEDLLFREDLKLGREPTGKSDRYNPREEGSFARSNHQQTRWR